MSNNGDPQTSTPDEKIAKQSTKEKSRNKSIELEMNKAENSSSNPNCSLRILRPLFYDLLNTSA